VYIVVTITTIPIGTTRKKFKTKKNQKLPLDAWNISAVQKTRRENEVHKNEACFR